MRYILKKEGFSVKVLISMKNILTTMETVENVIRIKLKRTILGGY